MTDTRVWHPVEVYAVQADRIRWRQEARNTLLVTAYVALLGSIVGIVWHAVAPRVDIIPLATRGSQGAMKPLIGADVWLGGLGLAAALVCVVTLAIVDRDATEGPGAMLGLAVGGLLGMLVAAVDKQLRAYVLTWDLRVRAQGVLLSWPLAAVLLNGVTIALRRPNEVPPVRQPAYPGSS
jgi:hypothetical protein